MTKQKQQLLEQLPPDEIEVIKAVSVIAKYTKRFAICDGAEGKCMFWDRHVKNCVLRGYDCADKWMQMLGEYKVLVEDNDE